MANKQISRLAVILAAIVIIGSAFGGGFYIGKDAERKAGLLAGISGKESPSSISVSADFAPFWGAWKILNEKFVPVATTTRVSEQEKIWGAIGGLAASFKDPYTVFLPPEEAALFETEISGNFQGVGMEIGIKDDMLTVVAPLKGTPAERAGVLSGDKILKIGDLVSAGMKVDAAVKLIRGPKGSEVRITLQRAGVRDPFEVKIMRDIIEIPTIDTERRSPTVAGADGKDSGEKGQLRDGVFIIRLYNFSANSPRLFRDALRSFAESGSNKLILDLRGNPGGFLEAAVDMASWFLPAGKVIVKEDSGGGTEVRVHRSRGYNVFNDSLKMIVLVNGGSASASEILAGALQSHKVARLLGLRTFGKGSVQELVALTPETALKVTVARWLTPDGVSISDGGLKPDIEVKMTNDDITKKRDPQLDKAIELLIK